MPLQDLTLIGFQVPTPLDANIPELWSSQGALRGVPPGVAISRVVLDGRKKFQNSFLEKLPVERYRDRLASRHAGLASDSSRDGASLTQRLVARIRYSEGMKMAS
jgi:hypothetical protein